MGWRKDNIRYKKNEVFLDIVEQARPSICRPECSMCRFECVQARASGIPLSQGPLMRLQLSCACTMPATAAALLKGTLAVLWRWIRRRRQHMHARRPGGRARQVNMLMSSKGAVLRCDVHGKIVMKVFLSGMPDVKLGLNDKLEARRPAAAARPQSMAALAAAPCDKLFCSAPAPARAAARQRRGAATAVLVGAARRLFPFSFLGAPLRCRFRLACAVMLSDE